MQCINLLGPAACVNAPERMAQLQHLQMKLFDAHFKRCDERMKKLAQDEVRRGKGRGESYELFFSCTGP